MNAADLSPNYAATIVSINLTFATMSGFVSPAVTGKMTGEEVLLQ